MSVPMISIMAATKLCGVSRRTIYNWLEANKVEYVRTAGGCVRILLPSLLIAGNVDPSIVLSGTDTTEEYREER